MKNLKNFVSKNRIGSALIISVIIAAMFAVSCSQPVYHTVSFDTNYGSSVSAQTVEDGKCATRPDNPVRVGSIFVGWYSDKKLTHEYDFSTPVKSDLTIYAKWFVPQYVKVSFDSVGGSAVPEQVIPLGDTAVEPADPTKTGAIFVGWYTDKDYTTLFDFSSHVWENTQLYARWQTIDPTKVYKIVTFDSVGGTPVEKQIVLTGTCATEPAAPTKTDYKLDGWYKESTYVTKYDFKTPVTTDLTLYAKWVLDVDLKPIGGRIYYISGENNGATYRFFDSDKKEISDITVSGLAKAEYYSISGEKTGADKFYVYNDGAFGSGRRWGSGAGLLSAGLPPTNSAYKTDDVHKYTVGYGKILTNDVYYSEGTEYENTIWLWLRDSVRAGKVGGYEDWFIPCADELDKLKESGLTSWFDKQIWSSVECDDAGCGWYWSGSGWEGTIKSAEFYAVAIRAF